MLDLLDKSFVENPYPKLKELREFHPICKAEPLGYWALTRYDDVIKAASMPKIFSSSAMNSAEGLEPEFQDFFQSNDIIGLDPPVHTMMRRIVAKAFSIRSIKMMEDKIRTHCLRQLDSIKENSFDLVNSFSVPFPVNVIADILGIEREYYNDFKRWSDDIISCRHTSLMEEGEEKTKRISETVSSLTDLREYSKKILSMRRKDPQDDLISAMINAVNDGKKLDENNIISMIRLFLIAGNETTTNLINHSVNILNKNKELLSKIRTIPSLIPNFIEEVLRFDSPVLGPFRELTQDYEWHNIKMKKGDKAILLFASANHDESKFSQPEKFDIERKEAGHLAFGSGVHVCIGAELARLEARIALEEIVKRWSNIEKNGEFECISSFLIRGFSSMNIKVTK